MIPLRHIRRCWLVSGWTQAHSSSDRLGRCTPPQPVSCCLGSECFHRHHKYFTTVLEPECFWFRVVFSELPAVLQLLTASFTFAPFLRVGGLGFCFPFSLIDWEVIPAELSLLNDNHEPFSSCFLPSCIPEGHVYLDQTNLSFFPNV